MIEKIWFTSPFWMWVFYPVLRPLSAVFAWLSQRRRRAYQTAEKSVFKANVPVIVVGNITAGGNGKTPIVIWLVERLQALGYQVGVVSRGYGAKAPHYPLLVQPTTPTQHCGDEPKLIWQRTGAIVSVAPIRSQAVQQVIAQGAQVIVCDDGLQHYALARDIEFVVVDGQRRFGNGYLLPLGPLREPITRLDEVHFVMNNGGKPQANEIAFSLVPTPAVNLVTGEQRDVASLTGLVAWAGIGHPPRFFATLQQLNAQLIATHSFADHQAFDQTQLLRLAQGADHVIMTEKDAVKCVAFAQENWWYLPVSAQIEPAAEQPIMDTLKEVIEHYGSSSI